MDYFRRRVSGKAQKDRMVSLDRRLYEASVHMIGKTAAPLYHTDVDDVATPPGDHILQSFASTEHAAGQIGMSRTITSG